MERFEVLCEDGVWKVYSYVEKHGRTFRNWVADGPSQDEAYEKRRRVEAAMWGR